MSSLPVFSHMGLTILLCVCAVIDAAEMALKSSSEKEKALSDQVSELRTRLTSVTEEYTLCKRQLNDTTVALTRLQNEHTSLREQVE